MLNTNPKSNSLETKTEISIEQSTPEDFEKVFVHQFYKNYSKEFSRTRVKLWPQIESFIKKYVKKDMLILDSGCGNGRTLLNNSIGVDISRELLKSIKQSNITLIVDDGMQTHFKSNTFDIIMSISVLHHFSTDERRKGYLIEKKKILKRNGYILLYVWSLDVRHKNKFKKIKTEERTVDNPLLLKDNDYIAIWNQRENLKRYYHLYTIEELTDLIKSVGLFIIDSGRDKESIYVVLSKTPNKIK